jgi:hypothetical protein
MTDLNYPSLIAQLGISGIFLFIAWQLYKDNKTSAREHEQRMTEKDSQIAKLNADLLSAYKENTTTNIQLKDNVKENTTLTQKLYEAIITQNVKRQ